MNNDAANRAGEVTDDEGAAIDRDLADIAKRLKEATGQEVTELTAAVRQARLRMIGLARSQGWLAKLMRPFDEPVSGNVVRFRRRGRW